MNKTPEIRAKLESWLRLLDADPPKAVKVLMALNESLEPIGHCCLGLYCNKVENLSWTATKVFNGGALLCSSFRGTRGVGADLLFDSSCDLFPNPTCEGLDVTPGMAFNYGYLSKLQDHVFDLFNMVPTSPTSTLSLAAVNDGYFNPEGESSPRRLTLKETGKLIERLWKDELAGVAVFQSFARVPKR